MKIIFVFILIFIILIIYCKLYPGNLIYVSSSLDNNKYLVNNLPDKQDAANLLASIRKNILTLNNYLYSNINEFPDFAPYISRLNDRVNDIILMENGFDGYHTSYSVNKGEKIVYCLRSKQTKKLYDLNLLMYVTLHELAHIASPEYNHTPLFKKIFAFLTAEAIKNNLYVKLNFDKNNVNYCGLTITSSIV